MFAFEILTASNFEWSIPYIENLHRAMALYWYMYIQHWDAIPDHIGPLSKHVSLAVIKDINETVVN